MDVGLMLAVVLLSGLGTVVGVGPILRRLPEPVDADQTKIAYRNLASTRFSLACSALSMLGAVIMVATLPESSWPAWMVLNTCGVLLVAIDARTTWLPLRLTQAAWCLAVVAAGMGTVITADPALLLRPAVGAALAGGLYFLGWLITRGGFGFGDVRFAPVLGAAAASPSWALLLWTLVLGTLVGGVHGLVRLVRRRSGGFAYAPSMLAGAYLAAALLPQLTP
jgi:leader peptidase (prepilin peptidase)/N-methyltransferase